MKKVLLLAVAFVATMASAQVLNVASIEKLDIPANADSKIAGISPDGAYVLITSQSNAGLQQFDLASKKVIEITDAEGAGYNVEISADWITRKETRAFNTDKLTFVIAENKDYDNREGTIVFKSKGDALSQIVKVYQAQKDALIISKKDIVVSAESGTINFELQTNVEFKVSEPNVDWLRAVTTRGLTTHTLHYEYDTNTSFDSREAQIIVTDTKNNKSETITITQAQKDAIVLAKDSYVVESEGGQIQIEVGHNIDFNVEISADWITKVDTRAFVTETLNFNIAKNPTNNNREGTIIFTSKNNTLSQKLKIIQNPHELQCVYVATKGTLSHILNELGLVPCDIHEIKISGYLNDEDFLIIREDMSSLEYLDISDVNITTLPAKALYKSTSIKTLLLPKTLLEIRENVFAYSHIQEVVIPQGVSRIGDSAFYNCDYLSSISFPSSVEVIEPNAFADCSSLYNIKFEPESKIHTIDGEFIVRDISTANNPYKYEYKYNGAFANCDKLGLDPISNTHIPIFFPASLETIGAGAFYDCDNLSQVLFDNKSQLKSINGASHDAVSCGAFEGCKITSINIPSSVEFIGEYSFYNCTALSSLIFEADSSLEIIGKNAFRNTSIKTLSIPSKVEIIDIGAFCDCDITSLVFMPSSNLKQINGDCGYNNAMNQNVKYDGAFANNPIATINFPASLEEIGPASFYNCKKLSIISFEKNSKLTKIEGGAAGAFMNTNLQTVDMSNCTNIKYLGPWIFYNISTLRLVKIGTITPPDTNYQRNSFDGIAEVAVLKVPTESIDTYKNSWMKTNFDSITSLVE